MVIGRLKELANDRTLVEKLARDSTKESKDQRTQQKLLAVSLDTECKKLNKKLNNLLDAIAETEDKEVRLGLTKKMQEIQDQLEKIELSLLRTKSEDEVGGNIVDVSSIFKFLKTIKSEFEQADISLQTQILKDVIHRIDICATGIKIKMYGVKPRIHLENPSENKPAACRSGVRSVFGLVDLTGIEPATSALPVQRSPS